MKYLVLIITLFFAIALHGVAQGTYRGENGKVSFFSDALLEDIAAESNKVTSGLNMLTGEVAVLIPIKSFEFDKSLMREHFNENYLESDKYPDATFTGKMVKIPVLNRGEKMEFTVSGVLTIHGISCKRDIDIKFRADNDGSVVASGKFEIKVDDHKIKVPSLLFQNIAEVVEVTFELNLKKSLIP